MLTKTITLALVAALLAGALLALCRRGSLRAYPGLRRFSLLAFAVPTLALGLYYLASDPFKVVWPHEAYYPEWGWGGVTLNHDHVSSRLFRQNNGRRHYDAFIFGNSRSRAFRTEAWRRHIGDAAECFHFDAHGESLYGLHKKVLYAATHSDMHHALLVLDHSLLEGCKARTDNHLFFVSPVTDGHALLFHFRNAVDFCDPQFLVEYTAWWLTGYHSWMKNIAPPIDQHYVDSTNEFSHPIDNGQMTEAEFYDAERMQLFYDRPATERTSEPVIGECQRRLLGEVAQTLKAEGCNIKVIVNPLYDQVRLHPDDMEALRQLFGDCVYDYSGINALTSDVHNYYETSHYRPHVAERILEEVYKD
ncbi:MAG: hypothetical protein J6I49_09465 [Bacteroidales bacterium]|nr:hypothetical protein [Bacteroidales bacterium]